MLSLFCFLSCLVVPSCSARPGIDFVVPAVAFSLTADYGIAALHLTNHSSVTLAKIDGGVGYKAFMRREDALPPDPWLCFLWRSCTRKPDTDAAETMINVLKASAMQYFGTSFCFVDIAMPDATQGNYQREIFEAAVRTAGLRQPNPSQNAGLVAVLANDPTDVELPDGQIVLAIDYSRSSLNLDLVCDDAGVLDRRRHEYIPNIGADSPDPTHLDAVDVAIRRILLQPFPDCPSWERTGHKKINHIVLYGDAIDNEAFIQAIKNVLGTGLVARARVREPVFGVALSLAEASYRGQNSIDFKGEAAFGCRWRSGLYAQNAGEL
ncbi:hypothetical protein DL546_009237 [Coniochaeta pulveracea]|uniref:Uncharacterized protein n=1 Tax=Coniochaeta pulveracea TaxID=177199 RepID=A0A420YNR6_9PEZI|nr:hypothetical protein DL546_009237 [Coniochaeta pulveracea]